MGEFDLALKDINMIFELLRNLGENEGKDNFYLRILIKAYAKQYAVLAIKGEFDEALKYIELLFENKLLLDEKLLNMVFKDKQIIELRRDNLNKKVINYFKLFNIFRILQMNF